MNERTNERTNEYTLRLVNLPVIWDTQNPSHSCLNIGSPLCGAVDSIALLLWHTETGVGLQVEVVLVANGNLSTDHMI